jgi:DNA-binding response OmpR family regulator
MDEIVKLLLVDDEERNLDALEAILASLGCDFVRAKSADEALLALLQHEFAAIVLDIKMPGTSGLELAKLIKTRKRNQHVPILFLTAHMIEEKDILHAYGVGGVDYLIKPINPEILRSKVGVFVDLFRTARALGAAVDALHAEIAEREKVQEELRQAKEELETRVLERTAELDRANREVRDSEATLSAILQNTSALVYLMDAGNRFVHINIRGGSRQTQ